jgi:hypothetical protein
MNSNYSLWGLAAGAAFLLTNGCSKSESPAPPAADKTTTTQTPVAAEQPQAVPTPLPTNSQPAPFARPESSVTVTPPVPAVATPDTTLPPGAPSFAAPEANQLSLAQTATNQALAVLGTTSQLVAATSTQVEALLDRAKSLTANQKYQEALNTLTQLYATKLTPGQKQKADDLKSQIQTAVAQKATSALGGVLGTGK